MTLDERIAKRKEDGWTLSHWVVKGGCLADDGVSLHGPPLRLDRDTLRDKPFAWTAKPGGASKFFTHIEAAQYCSAQLQDNWRWYIVPVFTRTIKVKRGHSFSWALARMKEGKSVRRAGWINPKLGIQKVGGDDFDWTGAADGHASCRIDHFMILSCDWELAE